MDVLDPNVQCDFWGRVSCIRQRSESKLAREDNLFLLVGSACWGKAWGVLCCEARQVVSADRTMYDSRQYSTETLARIRYQVGYVRT